MNNSNYARLYPESGDPESKSKPYGLRIIDQLRKVELCDNLRKKREVGGFKYDAVIKTRFDIIYRNVMLTNLFNFRVNTNTEIKDVSVCTHTGTDKGCISTLIYENTLFTSYGCTSGYSDETVNVGNSDTMSMCSSRYSNIPEEQIFCSHRTLTYALNKHKIKLSHTKFVEARALRLRKDGLKVWEPYKISPFGELGMLVPIKDVDFMV